jgi:drug/metabolite transporter (DMT)-like permease
MLFIPITVVATAFQVARNAMQRGLLDGGGPWGATLVRFLFALPFCILFVAGAWLAAPDASPGFSSPFWIGAVAGGAAQIGATAALLVSMHRSGFALAAVFQQSSLPLAALVAWIVLGEGFTPVGWTGVLMTSAGLLTLAWPRDGIAPGGMSGAWLGLLSGAFYAVALNAYRVATVTVEPDHPFLGAVLTTLTTQAMQSVGLIGWLMWRDRPALVAVLRAWRRSLGAGFFGAAASALWLTALGLAPAAHVRAVGVIEMPMAALAGRKLFAESLTLRQVLLSAAVVLGVVMAVLG